MTTRRFTLSKAECITTTLTAVVSGTAYVTEGLPPLPVPGVVGDLTGFLVPGPVGAAARARLRHEAAVCLVLNGGVLVLDPAWPLRVSEPRWWAQFSPGLAVYVLVRRRPCD